MSRTDAQIFAHTRNWNKGRLLGIHANLGTLNRALTSQEREKVKSIQKNIKEVVDQWDQNYKQAKKENL